MRNTTKRLAAVTGGLLLAAGTLTAGTAGAATGAAAAEEARTSQVGTAATCYGGAISRTFNMGQDQAAHSFGPYTTSSRCNDINLKITSWGNANPLFARICFLPSSGGTQCQSSWKEINKSDVNKWRVIATDVKSGTRYRLQLDFASNVFKGDLAH